MQTTFKICLFDLDDTLVRTEDLKEVREACKNSTSQARLNEVRNALAERPNRHLYRLTALQALRDLHPKLKLCVFTRSPRSYALAVLEWAYPGFQWDIVIAYEDVLPTKPHGDGIDRAMEVFGVTDLAKVLMVGDSDVDIRAAYNCGCVAVLDKTSWPAGKKHWEHWHALELVPDAILESSSELGQLLRNPDSFLPDLERRLDTENERNGSGRFDCINHFLPRDLGDTKAYPVYACGRSFTQYPSLDYRRPWHELTGSIANHKEAIQFSSCWVESIRRFISDHYPSLIRTSLVIATVPHRPGRAARLEALLQQVGDSLATNPIKKCDVVVVPGLLGFRNGVKSQHNDHLDRSSRFANIRDHLDVMSPDLIRERKSVLVLDDVVTTGASLIYSAKYLKEAGAGSVKCLAIAKSIGDVL